MPLPEVVERGRGETSQGSFGWREFESIAMLKTRPSYKSLARMFNKSDRTMKTWLRRYDEDTKDEIL